MPPKQQSAGKAKPPANNKQSADKASHGNANSRNRGRFHGHKKNNPNNSSTKPKPSKKKTVLASSFEDIATLRHDSDPVEKDIWDQSVRNCATATYGKFGESLSPEVNSYVYPAIVSFETFGYEQALVRDVTIIPDPVPSANNNAPSANPPDATAPDRPARSTRSNSRKREETSDTEQVDEDEDELDL